MKKQVLNFYNFLRNLSLLLLILIVFAVLSSYYLPTLVEPVTNRICQISGNSSVEEDGFIAFNETGGDSNNDNDTDEEDDELKPPPKLILPSKMSFPIRKGQVFLAPEEIIYIKKVSRKDSFNVLLTNSKEVVLFKKDLSLEKVYEMLDGQRSGYFLKDRFMIVNPKHVFIAKVVENSSSTDEKPYLIEFENGHVENITKALYNQIKNNYIN